MLQLNPCILYDYDCDYCNIDNTLCLLLESLLHCLFQQGHSYMHVLPSMRILSHTRMGWPIRVYPYRIPIRVWDNLLSHFSIFKNLIRMFLYRCYDNSGQLLYLRSTIAMVIPMVKQCKLSRVMNYACGDQSFFTATRSRRSSVAIQLPITQNQDSLS